jgi:hypothetical protein
MQFMNWNDAVPPLAPLHDRSANIFCSRYSDASARRIAPNTTTTTWTSSRYHPGGLRFFILLSTVRHTRLGVRVCVVEFVDICWRPLRLFTYWKLKCSASCVVFSCTYWPSVARAHVNEVRITRRTTYVAQKWPVTTPDATDCEF